MLRLLALVTATLLLGSCRANIPVADINRALSPAPTGIADLAGGSECAAHDWHDRGVAPAGYIKGIALTYAKAYCELKQGGAGPVAVMSRPLGAPGQDALTHYGRPQATPLDRLRDDYTLLIGSGMRESSGVPTEGRDTTVQRPTEENAEAGLFQTSHDSFGQSPALAQLSSAYHADPTLCRADVFAEGARVKHIAEVGAGAGAEYQRFTKSCPAFASEYAAVMQRIDRTHFGPINRREAEFLPSCRAMLLQVEALAACQ